MYTWMDDPNSTIDPTQSTFKIDHDVIKYTNILATNTSETPLSDVGVWLPYIWVRNPGIEGHLKSERALTWDNQQHGWFTSDFAGTHESLLVTATFITSPERPDTGLLAKNVADMSGTHDFPRTVGGDKIFELESIQPNDMLPFTDIGPLAVGQSKSFEVDFTYHWGGADLGAMRVGQREITVVPDHPTASSGINGTSQTG